MDKLFRHRSVGVTRGNKRGSAYIMVVFVSFPILLAALTAFAVSINSRNISARHTDFFGMYDLATAAVVSSIIIFEDAYLAYRQAAHRSALLHFRLVIDECYEESTKIFLGYNSNYGENDNNNGELDVNNGENDNNSGENVNNNGENDNNDGKTDGGYEESIVLQVDYINRFRYYLLPMIWAHFEVHFGQSGNELTRHFEINLGTDHVFNGTIRITRKVDGIHFRSEVIKVSDNIRPMRETVLGIIRWPPPAARQVYFCEENQIKNLDYFTPWVVELKKL